MRRVECASLEALSAQAKAFADGVSARDAGATVVGLSGDLGAGKTTFTQALARHLGVNEHVTSPTFVIQKIYPISWRGFTHLVHVDAYRLSSSDEVRALGWDELLSHPENLVLVEWPGNIADAMPAETIPLSFEWVNDTTRAVTFP